MPFMRMNSLNYFDREGLEAISILNAMHHWDSSIILENRKFSIEHGKKFSSTPKERSWRKVMLIYVLHAKSSKKLKKWVLCKKFISALRWNIYTLCIVKIKPLIAQSLFTLNVCRLLKNIAYTTFTYWWFHSVITSS